MQVTHTDRCTSRIQTDAGHARTPASPHLPRRAPPPQGTISGVCVSTTPLTSSPDPRLLTEPVQDLRHVSERAAAHADVLRAAGASPQHVTSHTIVVWTAQPFHYKYLAADVPASCWVLSVAIRH
eukprot:2960063-Pleurochrysis_carterae.AAC.1